VVILELIHADRVPTNCTDRRRPRSSSPYGSEGTLLLDQNRLNGGYASRVSVVSGPRKDLVTLNNFELIARSRTGDVSFKCLPYQLSTVGSTPTVVVTGNGESGFDSGEGA